jgi:hypothetical protein
MYRGPGFEPQYDLSFLGVRRHFLSFYKTKADHRKDENP